MTRQFSNIMLHSFVVSCDEEVVSSPDIYHHVTLSNEVLRNKISSILFLHSGNLTLTSPDRILPDKADNIHVRVRYCEPQSRPSDFAIDPALEYKPALGLRDVTFLPFDSMFLQCTTKHFRTFANGQHRYKWETIPHTPTQRLIQNMRKILYAEIDFLQRTDRGVPVHAMNAYRGREWTHTSTHS
jgi:hypothetical protein